VRETMTYHEEYPGRSYSLPIKKKCRKHSWRKVGSSYSKGDGLKVTKKRCIICGEEKDITE
jgi:hypothetical protein